MRLALEVRKIGRELVMCDAPCERVCRNQADGVLPRGLILEEDGRTDGIGCMVIGINPGRASVEERKFYRSQGSTYESVVAWWASEIRSTHPYYTRLRGFLDQVKLTGPILWTEVAKCENDPAVRGVLSPLTLDARMGRFLDRELSELPLKWPLIAVGKATFRALVFRRLDRTVIGVPHPTGSRGHFHRLIPAGVLEPSVQRRMSEELDAAETKHLWLGRSRRFRCLQPA